MTSQLIRTSTLCLACAAIGLSSYLTFFGSSAEARDQQGPAPTSPEPGATELRVAKSTDSLGQRTGTTVELVSKPPADAAETVVTNSPSARALEPWELEALPLPTPVGKFEQKYAGWTFEEINASYQELTEKLGQSCNTAFKDRHEAGLSLWRTFSEQVDTDGDGEYDSGGDFTIHGRTDGLFAMAGTDHFGSDLRPYVVWLPADQYPDLYEFRDELDWLSIRQTQLHKAGQGPQ